MQITVQNVFFCQSSTKALGPDKFNLELSGSYEVVNQTVL